MSVDRAPRHDAVLIALLVLAPATWAAHLGLSYWFVPVSCEQGSGLPMHLVTVTAMGVLAGTLVVARATARTETAGTRSVMARVSVILAAYFLVVVMMTGLVAVVMRPCA